MKSLDVSNLFVDWKYPQKVGYIQYREDNDLIIINHNNAKLSPLINIVE